MSDDFDWKKYAALHEEIQSLVARWLFFDRSKPHRETSLEKVLMRFVGVSMWERTNYVPPESERARLEEALRLCSGLYIRTYAKEQGPPPRAVAKRLGLPKALSDALVHLCDGDSYTACVYIRQRLRELDEIEAQIERSRRPRPSFEQQEAQRKATYDMPEGMYEAMLQQQKGTCRGCRRAPGAECPRLVVDHNHRTGRVRALLCDACNGILGRARDDAETLRRLAAILDEDEEASGWLPT